jgi:hypothetical protein
MTYNEVLAVQVAARFSQIVIDYSKSLIEPLFISV